MRLNKSTSHAVRILIDCAKAEGRLIKVAEIAQRLDITQQNAFKIVHLLSKAGFLASARGRNGGVRLSRGAAEIRIGDVVRSIESLGQEEAEEAVGQGSLHRIVDDALEAFISVLDQHTLEDMAAGAIGGAPGEAGGRPGKPKRRASAGRNRRGVQQSAPLRSIG